MDHNLIRDILPVYIKGETSAESNVIIEEHLNECEECRELYELLLADDKLAQKPTPYDRFEASMNKVKRHFDLRAIAAVLVSLVVVGTLFFVIFIGVIPTSSTEVEITPEAYRVNGDVFGEEGIEIAFHMKVKDGRGCINTRLGKDSIVANGKEAVYTVYNPAKIPFDDTTDSSVVYAWYQHEYPKGQIGIEKIKFHFKDKDVEYDIKDIIEEVGLLE